MLRKTSFRKCLVWACLTIASMLPIQCLPHALPDRGDSDGQLLRKRLEDFRLRLQHSTLHPVDMHALLQRGKVRVRLTLSHILSSTRFVFLIFKFQQAQVDKFCRKYNLSGLGGQLPTTNATKSTLYRHLLVNDKSKTLFCFAPKTGCTNLRVLFFITLGEWALIGVVVLVG